MFSGGVLMNLRPMMFSSSIMLFGPRLPAGVILHGDTRVVLVVSLAVAVAVLKSALPKRIGQTDVSVGLAMIIAPGEILHEDAEYE